MKISKFLTLFVFCIHVTLINSAGLQLRSGVDQCSTEDIERKQDELNNGLDRIKKNCIDSQRQRLEELHDKAVEKARPLTEDSLYCLQEVESLIIIAMRKLNDALSKNCDIGVRKASPIYNKFSRIIAELNSCVEFSNGCTQCEQTCCAQKRSQFYQNIDADISALTEEYSKCVTKNCDVINVDLDAIKNFIRDCDFSTTTTTEVTSTTTVTSTTKVAITTEESSTIVVPNTVEVMTTVDEISTAY